MYKICANPEGGGGQGVQTPLKNHKATGFLSSTGLDLLKNHKATKPAFNVGPGGPMMACFKWYLEPLPLSTLKEEEEN